MWRKSRKILAQDPREESVARVGEINQGRVCLSPGFQDCVCVDAAQYLGLGATVASLWSEPVARSAALCLGSGGLASRQEREADRQELRVKRHGGSCKKHCLFLSFGFVLFQVLYKPESNTEYCP